MKEFKSGMSPPPPKTDDKAPESLEDTQTVVLGKILDGVGAESLYEAIHQSEFASGDKVWAGTYRGIGYKNNEDRAIISRGASFAGVVDGVGGIKDGELAARILAGSLASIPENVPYAFSLAQKTMFDKNTKGKAVFASAQVVDRRKEGLRKSLKMFRVGDAKIFVFKKDGRKVFESEDQSPVQEMVDSGDITLDESYYNLRRNEVSKVVSAIITSDPETHVDYPEELPEREVEPGDMVLLMSDGISDNFTAEEIEEKIKEGLSGSELFFWLSEATDKRMKYAREIARMTPREQEALIVYRKKNGVFPDGYKTMPKEDNQTLVIMEIKQ